MQAIIGIFCIWLASRLLGAVARYFRQPAIIGELLAGILLGPSLIGHYYSFPSPLLDTLDVVAGALFLLTAGWEIRLTDILKFRRVGLAVSAAGAVVPLLIGYGLGTYYAVAVGYDGQGSPQMFACFVGIALSVSALPVIARTLMDMGLYRTRIGIVTMSAVTVDDLLGWTCFSLLLGLLGSADAGAQFRFFLPLVSYVAGVLIGEIKRWHDTAAKARFDWVVNNLFAPILFGSIALKLSFFLYFDLRLVLILVLVASVCKIFACAFAASVMGMPKREAWAIGFAMNSRGAMIIVLSSLAREFHIIGDRLLVGIISMAVVTSMMSAPLIRLVFKEARPAEG